MTGGQPGGADQQGGPRPPRLAHPSSSVSGRGHPWRRRPPARAPHGSSTAIEPLAGEYPGLAGLRLPRRHFPAVGPARRRQCADGYHCSYPRWVRCNHALRRDGRPRHVMEPNIDTPPFEAENAKPSGPRRLSRGDAYDFGGAPPVTEKTARQAATVPFSNHIMGVLHPRPAGVRARRGRATAPPTDGEAYLDCMAGIAVSALGHAIPSWSRPLKDQAEKLWHVSNIFKIPARRSWPSCLPDAPSPGRGVLHQLGDRGDRVRDQDRAQVSLGQGPARSGSTSSASRARSTAAPWRR